MTPYADYKPLTFHDAARSFADGDDTPRAYLERCLETIAAARAGGEGLRRAERGGRARRRRCQRRALEGRHARCRRSTACRSASRTCSRPRTCRPRWAARPIEATSPSATMPAVWALRQAGAVILGKTVTAELGGSHPGPTTNPFDPARTPGGSSSGSAAAVGASMVPAAIGTQVGGSIIRPAAYCGNCRAEADAGRHQPRRAAGDQHEHARRRMPAASRTCGRSRSRSPSAAAATAARSALIGPDTPAGRDQARPPDRAGDRRLGRRRRRRPRRPSRSCWSSSKAAGVTLIRRGDHPLVETLEKAIANGRARLQRDHRLGESLVPAQHARRRTRTASARAPRPRWPRPRP